MPSGAGRRSWNGLIIRQLALLIDQQVFHNRLMRRQSGKHRWLVQERRFWGNQDIIQEGSKCAKGSCRRWIWCSRSIRGELGPVWLHLAQLAQRENLACIKY